MRPTLLRYLPICTAMLLLISCDQGSKNDKSAASGVLNQPPVLAITKKIEDDPKEAKLYFQRGNLLNRMQEDSLALVDYKKAISLDSTRAEYYSALGDLLFEHKDIDGSAPWLEKALKLNPEDPTARLKVAKLFIYLKDYNKAFAEINTVLRRDAYNVEGYFLKGIIRKDLKDTGQAISSFQTILQIDPSHREATIELGLLYSGKRDPKAIQYFDNAFRLDTTDVFPLYAKAMYHQDGGAYEQAKAVYVDCITHDRNYSDAYFGMGWILMQQDSLEKAQRQFDIVTKVEPDNASAYYNKGLCSELLGQKSDALESYKQALIFDEKYAEAAEGVKRLGGKP